jgi:hypothetical protein
VQFPLVVASLRLAGWPAFAWMLALLTLLTLTMVSTWEGGADRPVSGGVVRRPQVGDPYAQLGEHASQ